jgi:hypothetical protein
VRLLLGKRWLVDRHETAVIRAAISRQLKKFGGG